MKLTKDNLTDILRTKPVLADEFDTKEVFALLGFKVKEYYKASNSPSVTYEVHFRRFYVVEVHVDNSRCLSVRNEYVDFGDDTHGLSFGAVDTMKQLIQTVVLIIAPKMQLYTGQISFDPDSSEYTEAEFAELVEVLNEHLFEHS